MVNFLPFTKFLQWKTGSSTTLSSSSSSTFSPKGFSKKEETVHRTLAKLSNQYGPILFLCFGSRPVLVVSSPSAAEECLSKHDIVFANTSAIIILPLFGHHMAITGGRNLRRVASLQLLSSNRVQKYMGIRMDEVKSLILRLFNSTSKGGGEFGVVEMKSMFFELTINVMMRMIAGKRYCSDEEEELEEERKFKEIVKESFQLSGATNIVDFVPILKWFGLNKMEKKLEILQRKRDGFMQNLIEERRSKLTTCCEQNNKTTMLDVLLSAQETDPEYYTDDIIRGFMQVLLSAVLDYMTNES